MYEIKKYVKARVSHNRWQHTLGVMETADKLAEYLMPDRREELVLAALLHDVAKELTLDEMFGLIAEQEIPVTADDLSTPAAMHSLAGAAMVKRDFPELSERDLISAIANHTLGAPDMSLFDKIIYISDYIEPGRSADSCQSVRKFLLSHLKNGDRDGNIRALNRSIVMAIDNTYGYLVSRNLTVNRKMLDTKKALLPFI